MKYVIETEQMKDGTEKSTMFIEEPRNCFRCEKPIKDKHFAFWCRKNKKFFHEDCIKYGHVSIHANDTELDEHTDSRVYVILGLPAEDSS